MWAYCALVAMVTVAVSGSSNEQYEQPYYSHSNGYNGDADAGYTEWGAGGLESQKCIDIPQNMSLCRGIGYTKMRLPNLLDHDTLRELMQQASSWEPLLGIRCHPDTKLFLCSLFAPVCLDRPIWPCRSLCEAVKNGCETLMLKYGFPWPEMLRCDKFPHDNDLCIGLQHDNIPAVEAPKPKDESVCAACSQPETYEAMADSFCSADYVLRIKVDGQVISGDYLKLSVHKKMKKLKKGSLRKRETRALELYVPEGGRCECGRLTEARGRADSTRYLAMGGREGDKLVLTYLAAMDMSKPDFKRAWRAMTRGDLCQQNGLPSLPGDTRNKPRRNRGQGNRKQDRNQGNPSPDRNQGSASPDPNQENPSPDPNQENQNPDLKRRKNCKNPKKCVSTGQQPSGGQSGSGGSGRRRKEGARGRTRGRQQD